MQHLNTYVGYDLGCGKNSSSQMEQVLNSVWCLDYVYTNCIGNTFQKLNTKRATRALRQCGLLRFHSLSPSYKWRWSSERWSNLFRVTQLGIWTLVCMAWSMGLSLGDAILRRWAVRVPGTGLGHRRMIQKGWFSFSLPLIQFSTHLVFPVFNKKSLSAYHVWVPTMFECQVLF